MRRRRFLQIAGMAAVLPAQARATAQPITWRGTALGADAMLELYHPDRSEAARLLERCIAEVRRLEGIFSLYQPTSAINRFNREGNLDDPPVELVELLSTSAAINRVTMGAFDPTVQPLWDLYASHFSDPHADPSGPSNASLASALVRVDCSALEIGCDRIRFAKPAMAITLNGIAQGYITDRVVDLLHSAGIDQTLVDMGEVRVLGTRPDGSPWRVGLEDPTFPGQVRSHLELVNRAVSTSGGYGFHFDVEGRFNHIFDPRTGECSRNFLAVSVVARTATLADALSTAFSVMPLSHAQSALRHFDAWAEFVLPDGSCLELKS